MADVAVHGNGYNGTQFVAEREKRAAGAGRRIGAVELPRRREVSDATETARRSRTLRPFSAAHPRLARFGRRLSLLLALGGLVAFLSWTGLLHAILWIPVAIFG